MSADKSMAERTSSNHREARPRLGPSDPRTRVVPARPDPIHLAIVITCLVVMTLTAIVFGTVAMAGRLSVRGAVIAAILTVTGMAVMSAAGWYFKRGRR